METYEPELGSDPPVNHRSDDNLHVKTLCKAALRGDWKAVETILNCDELKNIACVKITERGDTAFHIATATKQTAFVCNLVEKLNESDLELKNNHGYTAFCFAAASGVVEIAKVMYEKNRNLPIIRSIVGKTPLEMAIFLGRRKMVEYLYPITPLKLFDGKERMDILIATIKSGMCDIGLKILRADTSVVTYSPTNRIEEALLALAQKPLSHSGTSKEWIWERLDRIVSYLPCYERIFGSNQKRIQAGQLLKEFLEHILTLEDSDISGLIGQLAMKAARIGNAEFFTLLIHYYPDVIWKVFQEDYTIFHIIVFNRLENVFSLIHQAGVITEMMMLYTDHSGNNFLHLAGKLPPPSRLNVVSGAALQMQRELLWFKEVEKLLQPSEVIKENSQGKTPRELFTAEHEKLRKASEIWMKDTATSCMLVATLIATVAFAAAFTTPGGNKGETGTPIFLNNEWFTVFVISDAVAMFSSAASIVMFLSILTSRYGEDDFLFSLPAKLTGGLFTLFASIICMVLTFSATFFLVYKEESHGTLPKLVASLALLPTTLYVVLNYRLLMVLIRSTFWASKFIF